MAKGLVLAYFWRAHYLASGLDLQGVRKDTCTPVKYVLNFADMHFKSWQDVADTSAAVTVDRRGGSWNFRKWSSSAPLWVMVEGSYRLVSFSLMSDRQYRQSTEVLVNRQTLRGHSTINAHQIYGLVQWYTGRFWVRGHAFLLFAGFTPW